jgi:uncharacterized membrane protein YphA (DoxX/SURF4 family)
MRGAAKGYSAPRTHRAITGVSSALAQRPHGLPTRCSRVSPEATSAPVTSPPARASNEVSDPAENRRSTKPTEAMATTCPTHSAGNVAPSTESEVVHTTHATLRYLFSIVPIVAGADKFTNFLAQWDTYLNPLALQVVPVSASTFMHLVGVIEIIAGVLVFLRPRIGGFVVMAWLLAIAAQLLVWGRFLDIAVRDIVLALSGPLVLARLTPFVFAGSHKTEEPRA